MCHVNLDFTSQRQKDMFRHRSRGAHNRLVTLSQGITEINMPDGFGIPMLSTTPIDSRTMVLNHNKTENLPVRVQQRVTIDYIKNSDLVEPLTPLYRQKAAYSLVSMTGQPAIFGMIEPHDNHHDSTCLPGEAAGPDQHTDQFGGRFAAHWVIKPGEDVTHTVITEKMGLTHDIHAIGVHLHPFAESITLKDKITGEVIYESRPKLKEDVIGIEHVPYYSDQKPIPMYKNHDYEIVSVYNNISSEDQDAMAVFGIYTVDHDFNPVPSLVD